MRGLPLLHPGLWLLEGLFEERWVLGGMGLIHTPLSISTLTMAHASPGVCRGENPGSGARLPGFKSHFGSSLDVTLG